MQELREAVALTAGQRDSARSWLASREGDAPGRRLPSFGPSGHVGADAHSIPAAARTGRCAMTSAVVRTCKRSHPSGASILKPCKITGKGAPYGRVPPLRSMQTLAPES